MSVPNLSEAVVAALARLKALEQSPISPTKEEELPALNSELRKLRKLLSDRINALPWNEEKKELLALREKLDRALSSWEYEIEVDTSAKRLKELEKELSAGALNDSKRRKLQKERRKILALRKSIEQSGAADDGARSTAPAVKSPTQRIAEYEALLARALRSHKDES
jgi:hypothetical protein